MSRLPLVDPSQAQGQTAELFAAVKEKMGRVPNLMKAMANSPAVLEGYLGLSGALGHGTLDPQIRERIAIATADNVIDRVARSAHRTIDKLADGATGVTGKVAGSGDQLKNVYDEYCDSLGRTLREHPVAVVGAAFVIGVLYARLSR